MMLVVEVPWYRRCMICIDSVSIVHNEVLVERGPATTFDLYWCVDAVEPTGDLVHVCARRAIHDVAKTHPCNGGEHRNTAQGD
jgi:hypothetical protein